MAVTLLAALMLGLIYAAWHDLRTCRVPFWLMRGLWGIGIIGAAIQGHWVVAVAAAVAVGASSISAIPKPARVAICLAGGASGVAWVLPDVNFAAAVGAIFGAWLLWELRAWGGADAVIAIGTLALAPSLRYVMVLCLAVTLGAWAQFAMRHRRATPFALLGVLGDIRRGRWQANQALAAGMPAVWQVAAAFGVEVGLRFLA